MIGESLSFVSLSSQLRRIDVQGQTTSPTGKPDSSDQSHGKQLQGGDRPVIWRWFITTIKYIYIYKVIVVDEYKIYLYTLNL